MMTMDDGADNEDDKASDVSYAEDGGSAGERVVTSRTAAAPSGRTVPSLSCVLGLGHLSRASPLEAHV